MTVADTIFDTINDNWGNGGYAGDRPTIDTTEEQVIVDHLAVDTVTVMFESEKEDPRRVNDKFKNRYFLIDIHITSTDTAAQLKLIMDETEYLLENTTMTGLKVWNIKKAYFRPSQMAKYGVIFTVELFTLMSDSAISPSAGTTGDFIVRGDLEIQGGDIRTPAALSLKVSGDIDDYLEHTTVAGIPTITRIGGSFFLIKSDDVTFVRSLMGEDTSHFIERRWHKGSDLGEIFSTHTLNLYSGSALGVSFDTGQNAAFTGNITPTGDKTKNIGTTGTKRFDNIYADDFVNESPFLEIEKPLDAISAIRAKEGKLDYESLPDWVRATKRINQITETDKDGKVSVLDEGEKVVAEKGFSINRMCILLYQALQEATARIEALEAR